MNPEFTGDPRYRPIRPLGEGGMGRVWEVHDLERDRRVALKTLRRGDPLALFLFKNEFRALADLAHPHLVGLFELGMAGEAPFFTMELVPDGLDLLRAIRGQDHESGRSWLTAAGDLDPDATLPPTHLDAVPDVPSELPLPTPLEPGQLERLRHAMGQLAEALAVLHGAGKLHRDVKPSNVMVTAAGRVVLVDFGLVASLDPDHVAHEGMIAGSVPYMSPEQSLGAELTEASDWYAFGAVLYELLTGRPPFAGARAAVLAAKRGREVVPPGEVVRGVPDDLDRLCTGLLAVDPAARPDVRVILAAFGREPQPGWSGAVRLVGRERELSRMRRALDGVRAGHGATVHVRGRSGMGKSALSEALLEEVCADADALVLSARCYERDHVPFKAIDPLVDALVSWLVALPRTEAARLAPRHVRALATLFPVVDRVEAFAKADQRSAETGDFETQRRAMGALRELLGRIGEERLVVIHIDDLQWADRDSADLLRGLLEPPDPPVVLLLLAYRSEAMADNPVLRWLPTPEREHLIDAGPLSAQAVRELVHEVWPDASDEAVARVHREAEGSPWFTLELAHAGREVDGVVELDDLVRMRVSALEPEVRGVLEALAVASVPLPHAVALNAVEDPPAGALTALASGRFVRRMAGGSVECFHDRIREVVVRDLADTPGAHRGLARALERHGDIDADQLCLHWRVAGDRAAAIRYGRQAVAEAEEALAFDRAAASLRTLLELLPPESEERGALLLRLARALDQGGRASGAAEAYLAAYQLLGDWQLEARAAVVLLWGGELIRGRRMARRLLGEFGHTLPEKGAWRTGLVLWNRLRTRLAPLQPRLRAEGSLSRESVEQARVLLEMGFALVVSDQDLAVYVLTRGIVLARRLGHPELVGLALAAETFICHLEPGGRERSRRAFEMACALADQTGSRVVEGLAYQWRTVALVQLGEGAEAARVARISREQHMTGMDSPLTHAYRGWFNMFMIVVLGRTEGWRATRRRFWETLSVAKSRGDLSLEVHTVLGCGFSPWLLDDDPDGAAAAHADAIAKWPSEFYDLMHTYAAITEAHILLYRGRHAEAWALLQEREADARRSGAFYSGANRCLWALVALPAGLAAGVSGRQVRTYQGWVEDGGNLFGCMGGAVLSAWALQERGLDAALEASSRGLALCEGEEDTSNRLVNEVQHARLRGDAEAERQALEALRADGVRDPVRWMDAYVPTPRALLPR